MRIKLYQGRENYPGAVLKETCFPVQMEFGVVYSCVEDKMYTGRKGKGAYCNSQKLQVSEQEGGFAFQRWRPQQPALAFSIFVY